MTFIEKFVNKVRTEENYFVLNDGDKFYYFLQGQAGEARYIYGCYGFEEKFYIKTRAELELVAILKDGYIYIIDSYLFNLYTDSDWTNLEKSLGVYDFYNFCKEINKDIADNIFPALIEQLPVEAITDESKLRELKQYARKILLQGGCDNTIKCNIALNTYYVASILCGLTTVQEIVEQLFLEDIGYYKHQKANAYVIKKFLQSPDLAKDWERKLSEALLKLDAKTVTVYFTINSKTDYGKMQPDVILKHLTEYDYFCDYDFCVTMRGDDVIKTLEIATNRWNDDGRPLLTCEHITKITYGKKVLYEK